MSHFHAVVWLDHQKATTWQFAAAGGPSTVSHAHGARERIHSRKSAHGGHRAGADHDLFEDVIKALAGAHEILVMGPAQAKLELVKYLHARHPDLAKLIVAVENADHPSDAEVLAAARKHFAAIDRMLA
jgi:stalled ribosome rescue protein Dom34